MFFRPKVNVPFAISYKWSAAVMQEGFVPFPKRFLRCLAQVITDVIDLQVILSIVDYARPDLVRQPSFDRLAFTAGIPVELFKERVEIMCKRGWLNKWGEDDEVQIRLDGLLYEIERATKEDPPPKEGTDTVIIF